MKIGHFITYNDTYNGVYQSQVIDVVTFLNKTFEVKIRLIAFVPARLWKTEKKKIKAKYCYAKVFPILGSLDKIKRTNLWLRIFKKKTTAICRGPLAFAVAQNSFNKLIYDGRAAIEAEVTEYNVTGSKSLDKLLIDSENNAIQNAHFYIAVSAELIKYWEIKLGNVISQKKYVIIPCTLTSENEKKIDFRESEEIKVVYAGGTGPWQSFQKVVDLLDDLMTRQSNVNTIFLTKENETLGYLLEKYPKRCKRYWVNHDEVFRILNNCDYGILIRDNNVTNRVASPVKFAEYLNAGLKVLISKNIGDFSQFLNDNNCGLTISDKIPALSAVQEDEKERLHQLCVSNFHKKSHAVMMKYSLLVEQIV